MSDTPVETKPWERLPDEHPRDYQRFRTYRDTPPGRRDLASTAAEHGVDVRTIKRVSRRHRWLERAKAWDDEVFRTVDEARLREVSEMRSRHMLVGKLAVAKAIEALRGMQADKIPAGSAARLLELGSRIERDMLISTPESLLGEDDEEEGEDAWDALARELGVVAS